ncbi:MULTISPECIES: helix-turn-helix domain-containing protein [unclassified Mesorhizobium]|uniref:helix-turn-helix domain-containing protein n=1 Tax=unclassified Mesorhizobium TaxID=325217 RepID=UPI00095D5FD1|nr:MULTISPECIES: helix-turn-helix domain-containing protein [unclassified Mesorhizobium]MBN9253292.1 helix-turn-helix domain-containing protein [Mesorhizobium sp.]OJX82246.1 MAG: DNA-binding protein [Mesorhizobium sp. 65-26]
MDSLITAAARALAAGDPLGALNRVALREDASALALRGIAMAQLGDLDRAKALLRRAARGFGPREALARARCVLAEAEIALVSRDLGRPDKALDQARVTLEAHGDRLNAAHARIVEARRLLLFGRLDEAERMLDGLGPSATGLGVPAPSPLPAALRAAAELVTAGIAIRRIRIGAARQALARAGQAARAAGIAALTAEVESASSVLDAPAARLVGHDGERLVGLDEVEALFASDTLVVDACRNVVRVPGVLLPLASRPILFALARVLAEAWPGDASRETLVLGAFRGRDADESHRARLRVEIARLRVELAALAEIVATKRGFALEPRGGRKVVVLAPAVEDQNSSVLALLADGESWSSSALAAALDASARTVQRALEQLAREGKAQAFGRGRAQRWMTPPVPGFPTALLLPAPLPNG